MQTETKSKALHSVFIDTESKTYLFDGKPMQGMLGLDLHIEPANNYVTIKYCLDCPPEHEETEWFYGEGLKREVRHWKHGNAHFDPCTGQPGA